MSQEQGSTISGSVYDVYTAKSQEFRENRMPRVGQICKFEDGRKYVFGSTVEDLALGNVSVAAEEITTTVAVDTPAGVSKIKIVSAATVANQFQDASITFNGTSGTFKVKSNKGTDADGNVTVEIYDYLLVALTATEAVSILPSRPELVEVGDASRDPVGVAVVDMLAATAGVTMYGWLQYSGASVVTTAILAGNAVMVGANGAAIQSDGSTAEVGVITGTIVDGVAPAYLSMQGC